VEGKLSRYLRLCVLAYMVLARFQNTSKHCIRTKGKPQYPQGAMEGLSVLMKTRG
jgi:hypothetical protein